MRTSMKTTTLTIVFFVFYVMTSIDNLDSPWENLLRFLFKRVSHCILEKLRRYNKYNVA